MQMHARGTVCCLELEDAWRLVVLRAPAHRAAAATGGPVDDATRREGDGRKHESQRNQRAGSCEKATRAGRHEGRPYPGAGTRVKPAALDQRPGLDPPRGHEPRLHVRIIVREAFDLRRVVDLED